MKSLVRLTGTARHSLVTLFVLAYPLTVFAHKRGGEAVGFASGFLHPISGLDHILAMVAVGMWGAQLGAPAMWVLPVVFPMVMALGGRPPSRDWHRNRPRPSMASRTHSVAGCGSRGRDGRCLFSLESDFGRTRVRMHRPRLVLFWLTFGVTQIAAPLAHAHLMNTGFGPFYDGLTHLFVTPEDLLPVIALALLAGLRGPRFGRTVLLALPLAWLLGSAACLLLAPNITLPVAEIIVTIVTIALGALLAADLSPPLALVAGLAILLGLLHGILNGSELPKTASSVQIAAGVAAALFVAVSLLAGQAASVRVAWMRVAVRVAGSWTVAIGLLMLGWSMRMPG